MANQNLKKQVINIISGHRTGVFSSVENNKPHSRYMTFYHEDLTLYSPTQMDTEKMDEIEKNPHVSVLLGYEEKGQSDSYVEIAGTCSINNSETLKKQFWNESFQQWFEGPMDPNYVFLQVQPDVIRILNRNGEPAQELTLGN
ncbi:general stress protein [Niallia circulans]|uniref:General stress protein n=1 Tax=Niallia circulans TaxID=1397 RepID=A0A0J1L8D3_NIACI|nr:pyridoxamine 5'-phosphate oxidase family protein [Niallia circulans]KLV25175.1 general stress protein [Niallia circulans]MCM2983671.1 pyridoxamine 5'-phosphate oxidase family protein [Niallia circulans]MED5101008.1 pyridoxamine 5'-phosphate oxidase family protein [Niallia circulans]PAD23637.1 general stress protein [Niallia circulans]PAD85987.1 general stress protein [Niallia circulans]